MPVYIAWVLFPPLRSKFPPLIPLQGTFSEKVPFVDLTIHLNLTLLHKKVLNRFLS
jgi:hypothetical protein